MPINKRGGRKNYSLLILSASIVIGLLLITTVLILTNLKPAQQLKTTVAGDGCSDKTVVIDNWFNLMDWGVSGGSIYGYDPVRSVAQAKALDLFQQWASHTWNLTGGKAAVDKARGHEDLDCSKTASGIPNEMCVAQGDPVCTAIGPITLSQCPINNHDYLPGPPPKWRVVLSCNPKAKCKQKCVTEGTPEPEVITPCTDDDQCMTPASWKEKRQSSARGGGEPVTIPALTIPQRNANIASKNKAYINAINAAKALVDCNKASLEAHIEQNSSSSRTFTTGMCSTVGYANCAVFPPLSSSSCTATLIKFPPRTMGVIEYIGRCNYTCRCKWPCTGEPTLTPIPVASPTEVSEPTLTPMPDASSGYTDDSSSSYSEGMEGMTADEEEIFFEELFSDDFMM